MPTHSRGPPAPFPIAGQVAGSQIANASAACSPGGSRDGPAFLMPVLPALNSISKSRKHNANQKCGFRQRRPHVPN